jgi:hypothetical protein
MVAFNDSPTTKSKGYVPVIWKAWLVLCLMILLPVPVLMLSIMLSAGGRAVIVASSPGGLQELDRMPPFQATIFTDVLCTAVSAAALLKHVNDAGFALLVTGMYPVQWVYYMATGETLPVVVFGPRGDTLIALLCTSCRRPADYVCAGWEELF